MMLSTLVNYWESFLNSHPSNETSNKTLAQLFSLSITGDEFEQLTYFALSKPNTLFIAKAPISNHILFFHHTTKIGGTRADPVERLFVLVGTGSTAYPAQIDPNTIFASSLASPNSA